MFYIAIFPVGVNSGGYWDSLSVIYYRAVASVVGRVLVFDVLFKRREGFVVVIEAVLEVLELLPDNIKVTGKILAAPFFEILFDFFDVELPFEVSDHSAVHVFLLVLGLLL